MEQAAASLEASAKQLWTFYNDAGRAEVLLAMEISHTQQSPGSAGILFKGNQKSFEENVNNEEQVLVNEDVLDEWEIVEMADLSFVKVGGAGEGEMGVANTPLAGDCDVLRDSVLSVADGLDKEGDQILARYLVGELLSELVVAAAAEAETKYVEQLNLAAVDIGKGLPSADVFSGHGISDEVTVHKIDTYESSIEAVIVEEEEAVVGEEEEAVVVEEEEAVVVEEEEAVVSSKQEPAVDGGLSVEFEQELASCLVKQLKCEWAGAMAAQAQTKYWEIIGEKMSISERDGDDEGEMCLHVDLVDEDGPLRLSSEDDPLDTLNLEEELTVGRDDIASVDVQLEDNPVLEDETNGMIIARSHVDENVIGLKDEEEEDDSLKLVLSSPARHASALPPTMVAPMMVDAETSASDLIPITCDAESNTDVIQFENRASSPAPPPPVMSHAHSQTVLSIEDLETRIKEKEELELLKVDLHVVRGNLNQEKSQRLVAEELIKIIQSDLNSASSRTTTEAMARMQAENELTEVKGELSHCKRELKEKEERIEELEDTLKGTSLMVRKLEEQNAATLINRGGIDYMLQARLADGRAKEAEQKLQVLQTELLQSQSEVRMLLDRVSEMSRDRAEMVSNKVHNQLMSIADEKLATSERRGQLMEREILELRRRLAVMEGKDGGGRTGLSGLTSSGLTGYASSTMLGGGLTGLGSGGLGSGLGGMGTGIGSMGTGLGGTGYGLGSGSGLGGLGSGIGGLGSGIGGLGSGIGGLGSGLGGMGAGLGGMGTGLGGMGTGLGGMGTGLGGMGTGLGGSMGYGSGLGGLGIGSSNSSLGMGSSLGGMNSELSGMGTGLSSTSGESAGLTSGQSGLTGLGSGFSATTSSLSSEKLTISDSVSSYSNSSALTSSADSGRGLRSHDTHTKSRDYGLGKTSLDSKESVDGGFTLPSFDTSSGIQFDGKTVPRAKQPSGSHGDGSDGDSDSSDWSSSGDEGDGLSADMKPSTHATLISEWEWRAMKQGEGDAPAAATSSPLLSRKRPPPIAPKPAVYRTVTATGEVHFTVEPPSSFEEPSHGAALHSQQRQKPRGPAGRRLPHRWQKKQQTHHLLFT